MKRTQRIFTAKFKATVFTEALMERQSPTELATCFEDQPNKYPSGNVSFWIMPMEFLTGLLAAIWSHR